MPLPDLLNPALRRFRSRRLESLLIVVAVALGVSVVTAVAALLDTGRQLQAHVEAELIVRQLSLQAVEDDSSAFFAPGAEPVDVREIGLAEAAPVVFELDDLAAAKAAAPSVDYAYLNGFKTFRNADLQEEEFLVASAVTPEYVVAAGLEVTAGSLFTPSDFAEHRQVMLVTPRVVELLGLSGDPVGQQVSFEWEEAPYTIIGLLPDPDEARLTPEVLVPYEPSPFGFGIRELNFAVADVAELAQAQAELQAFAQERWDGRVSVSSSRVNQQAFLERQRRRSLVIAVFACLGLAVAALNIMALMLARVLRRQREIGITRSLGATRGLVRRQVLGEALALGLLGGLLGVGAGYGLLAAYNRYLEATYNDFAPNLSFSPGAVLVGLGLALGVGLLFGLYPALLASRVRVVEALREF